MLPKRGVHSTRLREASRVPPARLCGRSASHTCAAAAARWRRAGAVCPAARVSSGHPSTDTNLLAISCSPAIRSHGRRRAEQRAPRRTSRRAAPRNAAPRSARIRVWRGQKARTDVTCGWLINWKRRAERSTFLFCCSTSGTSTVLSGPDGWIAAYEPGAQPLSTTYPSPPTCSSCPLPRGISSGSSPAGTSLCSICSRLRLTFCFRQHLRARCFSTPALNLLPLPDRVLLRRGSSRNENTRMLVHTQTLVS